MDEGLLEQMCGDIGHSYSPFAQDDDSVDIYSGLDNSPSKSENAAKSGTLSSPGRLKDSMDLYEEIIKEEQQEKEATCNELKTKLDTAQSQVQELLHKLQQIQIQNTSLNTQNTCLKKNICALIKTARMEIVRKDEEINRLMQRSGRGRYGASFPRSQMNIQRNPNARQNSGATHEPKASPQTQRPRVNCAPGELPAPRIEARNVASLPPGPPCTDTSIFTPPSHEISRPAGTDTEVLDRPCDLAVTSGNRDSRILQTPSNKGPVQQVSKPYPGNNDMQHKVGEKQAVVSQEITGRKSQCSEGRDRQGHNTLVLSKENKVGGRERSDKECKESEKDLNSSSRGRHEQSNPELRRRSDRGKSPPHQRTQSPPSGSSRRAASSSHSLKIRCRDMEAQSKSGGPESRHGHDRGRDRDRGDRNVPESYGKEGKRSSSGQGSLINKSTASEARKGERDSTREQCRKEERGREEQSRNRGERKSSRTEKSKEYERSKGKETDKSDRESNRKKGEEKKDKESESRVDSNNCRQTTPPSTLTAAVDSSVPVKERHDRSLAPVQTEVAVKNGVEPEIPVEHGAGEKHLPAEGSQNKKLSFMETLNLTLSPVKKPRLSSGGKEQESDQPEPAPEGQEDDSSQFHLGEEYCVIDELESSCEPCQEMDEVFKVPAAESSGIGGAGKAQGPLPEPGLKNAETEHAHDKGEGEIQAEHVYDERTKCETERDQNVVLQTAVCTLPIAFVDQGTKLTTSQTPVNLKDHASVSKEDNANVVKTALPTEFPNSMAETHTGASVVQTILATDDDPAVCGSESEIGNSLRCDAPSVECVETVFRDPAVLCVENCSADNGDGVQSDCQSTPLTVLPEAILQDAFTSVVMDAHPKGDTTSEGCDVSTDAVSSTVIVEVDSQSYADVASDVVETVVISSTEPEKDEDERVTSHSQSKAQSTEVVSSTIRGEGIESELGSSGSVQVAQDCCSSEPDSTEDEERNAEPSSSVPFAHDEDSMMRTLNSIRHIPEAISPLTSPVRPVKKSLPHSSGKAQHVKCLSKDFSTVTGAEIMDVNKENEKPHCSSTQPSGRDSARTSPASSSSSDNELEEGEIVSDSEEDEPPVAPSLPLRKAHSTTTIKKQPSPRSPRLAKKQAQKTPVVSQGLSGIRRKTTPNNSPTSNKRHKTVLQLVPKTNPSTVPEVMDMLKSIRTELRKKYMKLHKSFPKKSFYNIIDTCLFSFTDFVNNVSFSECCSLESILKPKLNSIISTTMKKISDNGIVTRIFEQQSPSLKKKLWTFVEGQFDFLFREIQATFASLCKPPEARARHLSKTKNMVERSQEKKELHKIPARPPVIPVPMPERKAEEVRSMDMSGVKAKKINLPTVIPHRTGLGSRGKNLRMNKEDDDQPSEAQDLLPFHSPSKAAVTPSKNSSGEKPAACVRRLSHNGSIQDKSDFEILTEQQASSLTFNLVTDSQMGEIFKCLLQGSDLLENSVSVGDAHSWPVGTPRKDAAGRESYVVVTTPNKDPSTPSKVVTTWSAISPCRFLSPNSKIRVPLNPALLDESCLLEVPTGLPLCGVTPSSVVPLQRTYSILAEDLAVSLTIPSPLKSDSHLSFLHPESGEPMSVPESVISAHYSEDALMDGEDATEQDIHLALDSDNSSAGSNGCRTWEEAATPMFQFKPHLPMQAVVTEKSNDHFIVRIRHTSNSFATSPNFTSAEAWSQRVTERVDTAHSSSGTSPEGDCSGQSQNPAFCDDSDTRLLVGDASKASGGCPLEQAVSRHDGAHSEREPVKAPSNSESGESAVLSKDLVVAAEESTIAETDTRVRRKRKKHHSKPRAKRAKTEHAQERVPKQRRKKKSKDAKDAKDEGVRTPKRKRSQSTDPPLSPNSLSAKNIIRKKGEVVVTWTRDEDRYILVELKTKGASPETFSTLSAKINKPPDLIGKRFCQLMKLFKKSEKMES